MKKPKQNPADNDNRSDLAKYGISVIKTTIPIKVTKEDMLKDLVNKVGGTILTKEEITKQSPDNTLSDN